jgi:hypothetical protein
MYPSTFLCIVSLLIIMTYSHHSLNIYIGPEYSCKGWAVGERSVYTITIQKRARERYALVYKYIEMYIYVCICVYKHIYIYMCIYTYMYMCMYVCIYIYIFIYIYKYIYKCIHIALEGLK